MTALISASSEGAEQAVQLLIKNGAKLDLRNILGHTALEAALGRGQEKVVKILEASFKPDETSS